ncbi:MAG: CPBP family intramembrane metalloprotease [Lachnospiraceae bacterium]|nr:CPBP family intramembrane metalloprotease [Lachnospiraceae bacterium]
MQHNNIFYKIWAIFKPFIMYYFCYTAVFILLLSLCRFAAYRMGSVYQARLINNSETVTGLVSGLSMVIAVLPLIPMLRGELAEHRRSVQDKTAHSLNGAPALCLTVVLAVSASLGLNSLLTLTGLVEASAGYRDVARQQYGVVFAAGMVLYGLIAPVTEEIVFRGLVFNRLRRYCPPMTAVFLSGILFGLYHGNLVQGLYGGCMGILMAYLYERMHSFLIPCLFHATANLMVYTAAQSGELQGWIFTVPGCIFLLAAAAGCVIFTEKIWNR